MNKIDVEALDPGIRRTVLWLRSQGFETTDSGDGKSKLEPGTNVPEEAETIPHVFMVSKPASLVASADRLVGALRQLGLAVVPQGHDGGAWVGSSYDPADGTAVLSLHMVDDAMLPAPGADFAALTAEALADTKSLRDLNELAREPEARSSR